MKKKKITIGPCTAEFALVPVLPLIDHYFEGSEIFPPRENGKEVKLYEIDGYYLVLIENNPLCFLDKESAIQYIEMHGITVRDRSDDEE